MGSHALTRMPPVGELQQDGRLTVTDQRLFGDPDYLLRIITRDLPPTSSSTTTPRHHPRRLAPQLHPRHETCRGEPAPAPMRTEGVRHLTGLAYEAETDGSFIAPRRPLGQSTPYGLRPSPASPAIPATRYALKTAAKRAALFLGRAADAAALCCLGDVVRRRAAQGGLGGVRSRERRDHGRHIQARQSGGFLGEALARLSDALS